MNDMGKWCNAPTLCPTENLPKTQENAPQAKLGTGGLDIIISSTQLRLTDITC